MKTRVLVIDDCPNNRRFLAKIISNENTEVHFAESEDQALYLILNHWFSMALIKHQMPSMPGAELMRLIRELNPENLMPMILIHPDEFQSLHGTDPKQAMDLMRDHFITVVSHEMRSPLGAVIGFAELLNSGDLDVADRPRVTEAILRNSEVLLRLVDDILDFSRIEKGKIVLNLQRIDLRLFLQQLQMEFEMKAGKKGLSMRFEIPEKNYYIIGDEIRIRQMLVNLLNNALKFTEIGEVRMSVTLHPLTLSAAKSRLIFRVEDSGVGIRSDAISRLFKPFGQADTSLTRERGGTGLGLVISRQLARLMGGDLQLISTEPGRGSVFEASIVTQEEMSSFTPGLF